MPEPLEAGGRRWSYAKGQHSAARNLGELVMGGFFRMLFGLTPSPTTSASSFNKADHEPTPIAETAPRASARTTSAYFDSMVSMQKAIRANDFSTATRHAVEGIRLLPAFVAETKQDFGQFDIRSIPCIDEGGRIFALTGDATAQAELVRVVTQTPELSPWLPLLDRHRREQTLVPQIIETVRAHPGCLQTDLKEMLCEPDGRLIATLLSFLERAGRIARVRNSRTYALYASGSDQAPPPPIHRAASSHRSASATPPLTELELSDVPLVTLPRAPARWEPRDEPSAATGTEELFEVIDAPWSILTVEKIAKSDRPDPSFRLTYPSSGGTLVIDDLGKAESLGVILSAALLYDPAGQVAAKAGFDRDLYRIGVHPLGQGFIGMSRNCILHAYDAWLQPRFETPLSEAPEIIAAKHRLGIDDDELRNHIRCVGLSQSGDRYLFTIVDEAWCISEHGDGIWGVKLPIGAGWTRRTTSDRSGTSADVDAALALMSLSMPLTPADLKTRYRQLAKEWHPDLNPHEPAAPQRMRALNDACELLTGVDAAALSQEAGVRYFREIDRHEVRVGGDTLTVTLGYEVGERSASDWIYAASFASGSNGVYLAGYSGRIVSLDAEGRPAMVYDIGAVPRRIVELNGYLYLLTDTRLYVLRDDVLHALIDVSDGGDLVLSTGGFGLLEKKQLRWFAANGTYLGSLVSKDPIRRVYLAGTTMIVESRQTRCALSGVEA